MRKTSGCGAEAKALASKTVLKIRWKSFSEYLAVELAETESGVGTGVGARDIARVKVRLLLFLVAVLRAPLSCSFLLMYGGFC